MINEIYIDGKMLDKPVTVKKFNQGYHIRCHKCLELIKRISYNIEIIEKEYICKMCVSKYYNPMFNPEVKRKHSDVVNSEEYFIKMRESTNGEKNGFYGKSHNKNTIDKLKTGFFLWKNNLTNEEYDKWRKSMTAGQKKSLETNPKKYRENKSNAARESHKSQFSKKGMNKIERIVHDYLLEISENFKYSPILGYFQFDFGIKDKRILIEVDGDYWHGNPAFYNNSGCEGKKILNSIQLKNIKRDLDKNMFAEKNNLKIIRIWESQIKDGSFKEILKNKL